MTTRICQWVAVKARGVALAAIAKLRERVTLLDRPAPAVVVVGTPSWCCPLLCIRLQKPALGGGARRERDGRGAVRRVGGGDSPATAAVRRPFRFPRIQAVALPPPLLHHLPLPRRPSASP